MLGFVLRTFLISVIAFVTGCAGGAPERIEPGYPPEEPRQPERLALIAPNVGEPLEWWRANIFQALPADTYDNDNQAEAAAELLAATNAIRVEHGLAPVEPLPLLDRVAQAHARDQAIRDYWSHRTPEGLSSRQRILAASGYSVVVGGENSAIGNQQTNTPGQIVHGWLTHSGHRELLLNPAVTHMGAGVDNYRSGEWTFYVQLLVRLDGPGAD